MAPSPITWVLTDGRMGNERQALALARAVSSAEPRIWRLDAGTPWRWASPRKLPGSEGAFGEEFRQALREPPALAIGCGRQAALATRLLRQAGARSVQILDPRIDARHWDAVVVPEHDRLRGPNVVTSLGGLHEIDADWLARARGDFPQFESLPSPRVVLLLGGPVAEVPLDQAWWQRMVDDLHARHRRDGGSLSICASPRTPSWMIEAAGRDLCGSGSGPGQVLPGARWLAAGDGANPYPGMLGWAERIVVSADSVNMISEACATSVPVAIAAPELAGGRHAAFLRALMERGRVSALGDGLESSGTVVPLIELPRVAAAVKRLIAL